MRASDGVLFVSSKSDLCSMLVTAWLKSIHVSCCIGLCYKQHPTVSEIWAFWLWDQPMRNNVTYCTILFQWLSPYPEWSLYNRSDFSNLQYCRDPYLTLMGKLWGWKHRRHLSLALIRKIQHDRQEYFGRSILGDHVIITMVPHISSKHDSDTSRHDASWYGKG